MVSSPTPPDPDADAGDGAFIVRCVAYGDADTIVHLVAEQHGRVAALARGARRSRARYRARLEPLAQIRVQLRPGKGDLAHLTDARGVIERPNLRRSWTAQRTAAVALDLMWRVNVADVPPGPAYHLTHRLLDQLDAAAAADPAKQAPALLAGFATKLLVLTGVAPHVGSCVRCGDVRGLAWWSPSSGGVVCTACSQAGDTQPGPAAVAAIATALSEPLARLPDAAPAADWNRALDRALRPFYAEHLGIQLRRPHETAGS